MITLSTILIVTFLTVLLCLLSASLFVCPVASAQETSEDKPLPTIAEKTAGMEKLPGFLTLYWDDRNGRIWLEIGQWETELLYVSSLPAGVGSNDIGLDRGELGKRCIVKFQRSGPKALMVQPSYSFRAISDNPDEQRTVQEAFAQSIIWGFQVAAEEGERVLVDASEFYLRDAKNVVGTLKRKKQGEYKLDTSRCAFYRPRTKNFPQNTEVEVTLTYTGDSPGSFVRQVVPTPEAITVRQHHSFVQLPDDDYEPRAFDPRAGFGFISYMDFAAPIDEPIVNRFIRRHRLRKKTPGAPLSEPVKPIIYYVDRGAPEPIRSALVEGAQWWNQAFEAIGYKNAFQVELLPEGADPMDLRYNMIQWVHRSTRGWSYGDGVTDPRTGEIIKGHVTIGSLRVRQDYLIAQGLLAPYEEGKPVSDEMQKMALARIRQLSVHEVGHAIGLTHSFASSAADRASVMDYPHPLVKLNDDGTLDLSEAYSTGVGEWDKFAIEYGYQDFPDGVNEAQNLSEILKRAIAHGFVLISDRDARPAGGAHPQAHLWDNGLDPVEELKRVMEVRAHALNRFSENNIRMGAPMGTLEEVLVPVYMFHRYQVEAASKVLGGAYYTQAIRGDGQRIIEIVPPRDQLEALNTLLRAIRPEELAIPERILQLIPPRPDGYQRGRETFKVRTGVTFDPLAAAEALANLTIRLILHAERAARLVEYHARKESFPSLGEVMNTLIESTWKSSHDSGYHAEVQRVVNNVVLYNLMSLAVNENAAGQVRAITSMKIHELKDWLTEQVEQATDEDQQAHHFFAISQIKRFEENPKEMNLTKPVPEPPGAPIGFEDM